MRRFGMSVGVLGLLLLLLLIGCGGGGLGPLPTRPATSPPTTSRPTNTTVRPTVAGETTAPRTTVPLIAWEAATGNLAGMASECGTVSLVAAQPDSDLVVAGVALQGLWALGDAPATWSQLAGATFANRPSWIEWDPADPDRFWESGIYNGGGVYETTDRGATFRQLGDIVHIDRVSVDLSDPARRTMLAGEHESAVVYRSTDGGGTWIVVSDGLPDDIGQAFAPLVLDANTYLLGTKASPAGGIFRTTDAGATWTQVHVGEATSQPLVLPDGTIVWGLLAGMVISHDEGATWSSVPGPTAGTPSMVGMPDGGIAALSRRRQVVTSPDQGATWAGVGAPLPFEAVGFTYSAERGSFYAWRLDCGAGEVPVGADNIQVLADAAG